MDFYLKVATDALADAREALEAGRHAEMRHHLQIGALAAQIALVQRLDVQNVHMDEISTVLANASGAGGAIKVTGNGSLPF
jgi:hypothetical protein